VFQLWIALPITEMILIWSILLTRMEKGPQYKLYLQRKMGIKVAQVVRFVRLEVDFKKVGRTA
jgi:hypothetical protein